MEGEEYEDLPDQFEELKAELIDSLDKYLHQRLNVREDTFQQRFNEAMLAEVREQTFALRLLSNVAISWMKAK